MKTKILNTVDIGVSSKFVTSIINMGLRDSSIRKMIIKAIEIYNLLRRDSDRPNGPAPSDAAIARFSSNLRLAEIPTINYNWNF